MLPHFTKEHPANAIPIRLVARKEVAVWLKKQTNRERSWLISSGFNEKSDRLALCPDQDGRLTRVILVLDQAPNIWPLADLPALLPKNTYFIDAKLDKVEATAISIGWGLGTYFFARYRKVTREFSTLVLPKNTVWLEVQRNIAATFFVRDLINTPAHDMGPNELEESARALADSIGARIRTIKGLELSREFPSIHAVGKGSARAPRLIDVSWGHLDAPKVTLVGKGVTFDTGGLNLKTAAGMRRMKKDMGGAAVALGLAYMIMDAGLNLRLRVLLPVVENAVSGNAYRPGDVVKARNGASIEIGNTDAEGRVILADALDLASEDKPNLIIDFATLTGAARVALGPDLPAVFTDDDDLYLLLEKQSSLYNDPIWRLPLWQGYRSYVKSNIADLNNVGGNNLAGAITAALFLKEFVRKGSSWIHVDLYGWNDRNRPGRPLGGDAMAMRAIFGFLREKYGS